MRRRPSYSDRRTAQMLGKAIADEVRRRRTTTTTEKGEPMAKKPKPGAAAIGHYRQAARDAADAANRRPAVSGKMRQAIKAFTELTGGKRTQ